jgi:hypothetical protein
VPPGKAAAFAREWNAAFALVLGLAALLFAAGHHLVAAIAVALAAAAVVARRGAMRRLGRGFYGQEKPPRPSAPAASVAPPRAAD